MNVVWDQNKAASNLDKHKVDFADAAIALEDENALTLLDDTHGEGRFRTLGMGPTFNILYVIHAEQDEDTIRIISARNASKAEERVYFEGGFK